MAFWDWKSAYKFQSLETTVQPGSLESEAGIFASAFDRTGLRLITCEADKTIKIWKEDPNAVRICFYKLIIRIILSISSNCLNNYIYFLDTGNSSY
jgi:hypothetical protein